MSKIKITNAQRKKNIIKNISYLIRSRDENKASFSDKCGLTRTTTYKIIDGKVNNVHKSTINRISQFFGIPSDEIELFDLEEIEKIRNSMSIDGNKNPSAVPIIAESIFLKTLHKTIGFLVMKYPLTYIFNDESEVVAMKVESNFCKNFSPGDILIIRRIPVSEEGLLEIYRSKDNVIKIKDENGFIDDKNLNISDGIFIGCILEKRR